MAFEVYKPRGEKAAKAPLVTLSKNSIVLNKDARLKLNAEKVELAFDPDTKTIIKATEDGQNIKKTKLFAKGFYNHFNINAPGKYKAEYNENENALYVGLTKGL